MVRRKIERQEEHFRLMPKPNASKKWGMMGISGAPASVRCIGWRVRVAHGTVNLRRSPRESGGKDNKEQVSSWKVQERGQRPDPIGQRPNRLRGEIQAGENRIRREGGRTVDKRR